MSIVVEFKIDGTDLSERMNNMRAWLDHRRCEPISFRVSSPDAGPWTCRVRFTAETDAAEFARTFGGSLLQSLAGDAVAP